MMKTVLNLLIAAALLVACGDTESDPDSGTMDAGSADVRVDTPGDAAVEEDSSVRMDAASDAGPVRSSGCGTAAPHAHGGVQLSRDFSGAAGGERSFFLTTPADYDADTHYAVVVGFAGTNWSGEMIRPYLQLETQPNTIYVYPDLLFRDFPGWGNLGGWLLGPHAAPANGLDDIEFVRELLDYLEQQYCVDTSRVFATGHSWGGDMAAVVGCFLGDRFRAVAPAAANRPYWFDAADVGCVGESAVWTFFGQNETHFTSQDFPGQYGDEQVDFWRAKHGCGEERALSVGGGECVEWDGCSAATRYCFYEPDAGHQIPSYFSATVEEWFASFE